LSNIIKLHKSIPNTGSGANTNSQKVSIEFTREQFVALSELITLGELTMNSRRDENELDDKYIQLLQYVFSHAANLKLDDLIEYDKMNNYYRPTERFDEEVILPLIDEYDDATFWDELQLRLAQRDMLDKHGYDKLMAATEGERLMIEESFIEKYSKEFEANGLDNLTVNCK